MSAVEEEVKEELTKEEEAFDIQDPGDIEEPVEESEAEESEDESEEAVEESSPEEDATEDSGEVDEEEVDDSETEESVAAPALDTDLIYKAAQVGMTTQELAEFEGNPAGLRQALAFMERRGVATPAAQASEQEQRESIEDYEARLKEAGHDDDIISELVQSRKDGEQYRSELTEYRTAAREQENLRISSQIESVMDTMKDWKVELGDEPGSETAAQSANREKVFGELTVLVEAEAARGRELTARNLPSLVKKAVSNALPAAAKKKINGKKIASVKKRQGQMIQKPSSAAGDPSKSLEELALSNLDKMNPSGKSEIVDEF